jgi:hypothetical protein
MKSGKYSNNFTGNFEYSRNSGKLSGNSKTLKENSIPFRNY